MGPLNIKEYMNKLFLFCLLLCGCSCLFCASYTETPPNVRTIDGGELCQAMCDKLIALDKKNGNEDCKPYYEDIIVDGKTMSCVEFCQTMMTQSVDLHPECVLNNVEVCSVDMSAKCGL
jgi:hypothetical protein